MENAHVDNVVNTLGTSSATSKVTGRSKSYKLKKIIELRESLKESHIPIPEYEPVDESSSDKDISEVVLLLSTAYNRMSIQRTVQDMGDLLSTALECICNGERDIPILGKVDFTGVGNTIHTKLSESKVEIGELVESMFGGPTEDGTSSSIGPGTRLALKLLPTFLIYPHTRAKQQGYGSLGKYDKADTYRNIRDTT
jgi:hypothetical protein